MNVSFGRELDPQFDPQTEDPATSTSGRGLEW
jgi:hypothetical protein